MKKIKRVKTYNEYFMFIQTHFIYFSELYILSFPKLLDLWLSQIYLLPCRLYDCLVYAFKNPFLFSKIRRTKKTGKTRSVLDNTQKH